MKELNGNPDLLRNISTLGLKPRTFNALEANGYTHVGELVALSDWRVLKREVGMGETALLDIKTKLASIGLTTQMTSFPSLADDLDVKEVQLRDIFRIPAEVATPTDNLFNERILSKQESLFETPSRAKGRGLGL